MGKEKIGQRGQAPPETYNYLHTYRGRIYNHPSKSIGCSIQEERFCKETGGSCMDLIIKQEEHGIFTQWHAHITDRNEVVAIEGEVLNLRKNEYTYFNPNIEDMISEVKDIQSQFDNDPYDRPLV